MKCAIYGCKSNGRSKDLHNLKFFRFPKLKHVRKAWINACKRKNGINITNARLCSNHFTEDDYVRDLKQELLGYSAKNKRLIKPDAIPTLDLPTTTNRCKVKSISQLDRQRRMEKRKNSEFVDSIIKQYDELNKATDSGNGNTNSHEMADKCDKIPEENPKCPNSTVNIEDKSGNLRKCGCYKTISNLEDQIIKLKQENKELREKCEAVHGRFFMSKDNNKSQQDTKMEIVIYAVDP